MFMRVDRVVFFQIYTGSCISPIPLLIIICFIGKLTLVVFYFDFGI